MSFSTWKTKLYVNKRDSRNITYILFHCRCAAPKPATRASPLDKQSKDLANKRITAKAAPPRTATTKVCLHFTFYYYYLLRTCHHATDFIIMVLNYSNEIRLQKLLI